uniref:Putative photolyase-cryptochrome n=1 Tax=Thalassocalyce inconstans TaxID=140487 RepID=A0A1S6WNG5_THAIN|nr:putative photolyase-cryptochrome [Thalassocalyce inconstans]
MTGHATIHWFRKGLRLHDNAALLASIESTSTLIPLYILDTHCLDPQKVGANRMGFLLATLKSLDDDLREKGSKLFVAKGRPVEVIDALVQELNVQKLTFERDTEPYNKDVDKEIMKKMKSLCVEVHECWGHTLFNPDHLLSLNGGKSPLNMTGFLNLVSKASTPPAPMEAPTSIPAPPNELKSETIEVLQSLPKLSDLQCYGYNPAEETTWFVPGEKEAIGRMEQFLAQKKRVAGFEKPKTDPTSLVPDTTALSPYLSCGSLSVRLFYSRLKETLSSTSSTKPPVSLEGQIYWRELAYLIGYSTPNFGQMVGNPVCMQIPWYTGDNAKEFLKKWEEGLTGYPAVDAAMNQLRTEGWMHHLARHLVACFLTRGDLWVSWELGRDVFEKYLLDADWSINNFSWHWLSCSAFFHAYFRCYGPTTFFKKTDKNGAYIRKYVPLLKKFPDEFIYEPWLASKATQQAAGCIIGEDYPKPIVDHKVVNKQNMEKMKLAYANNKKKSGDEPPAKKKK